MILARPAVSWAHRYARPARHRVAPWWLFEPVDLMIARSALERLRYTHLSIDTAELNRKALTALLER